jgi:hypothetical protein
LYPVAPGWAFHVRLIALYGTGVAVNPVGGGAQKTLSVKLWVAFAPFEAVSVIG